MTGTFPFLVLWNPAAWAGVLLAALALWRSVGPGGRARWAFRLGIVALLAAFGTPLAVLSEHSLTAAMGQRLLVTAVAAPLLLAALAPSFWRRLWGGRTRVGQWLTHPLVALVLFNGAYVVTAVPALWDWFCTHPVAFWAQNLVLLGVAGLFWWPVLSPLRELPRLHPLPAMGYLFVGGIALTPLFVYWSLVSHTPAYSVDATGAHLLGLSPLNDQRLGGLVMKVGALVSYGVVFVSIFWHWWEEGRGRGGPGPARTARSPVDLEEVRRHRLAQEESS